MPLNLLINATPLLGPMTGVGNYTYQVAKCLEKVNGEQNIRYYYGGFFSERLPVFERKSVEGFHKTKKAIKKVPVIADIARLGWDVLKKGLSVLHGSRYDIYWEPNYVLLGLPATQKVVTIHDFSFHLHPEWHTRETAKIFKKRFFKNIKYANRIITDSQFVKNEAIDILNVQPEMINVIYCGVDHLHFKIYDKDTLNNFSNEKCLPESFILCVGSIEPRKNLLRLLDAYQRLPDNLVKDMVLLLAGFSGWENEDIMSRLKLIPGKVQYLGHVSNIELAYLYNLATVFIYPSLYEGFGLPPLEAMACGTPVLLSGIPVHREIFGDAAYYFDPMDVDGIAEAIARVMGDTELQKDLAGSGLAKAVQFSWEKSAAGHLQVFKELAGCGQI